MNRFMRHLGVRAHSALERFEPWIRRPLTVFLTASAASALCGIVLHPRGLAVAVGLLAMTGVGVVWPRLSLLGLRATMAFERSRIREGGSVTAHLTLRNRLPWPACGLAIRLTSDEDSASDTTAFGLAAFPGLRTETLEWTFHADRRGVYPRPGASISTGFPFGLWPARRPMRAREPLIVWPRTIPIGPLPDAPGGLTPEGSSFRDRPGNEGDPLGVRPYRRGDPLRLIHWPQTARHDQLILCERQSAASPRVWIVLDVDPEAHHDAPPDDTFEWSIRYAASLLESWMSRGAAVGLLAGTVRVRPSDARPAARRTAILDRLAELEVGGPPLSESLASINLRRSVPDLILLLGTERSRERLSPTVSRSATTRWVLFNANRFASTGTSDSDPPDPSSPRPRIWVEEPNRRATPVFPSRREVIHGA